MLGGPAWCIPAPAQRRLADRSEAKTADDAALLRPLSDLRAARRCRCA